MIKAVIFDMDGLMIDSEPIQSKGFAKLLVEHGKKPIYDINGLVQKVGYGHNTALLKEKYNLEGDVKDLRKKRQQFYQEVLETETINSMPGLNKLLDLLKHNNFKIAVATASTLSNVKTIFLKLNLNPYFDVIVTTDDIINGKPAPDIYLKAAKRLNIKPTECLVLEDSETGVAAGKSAGMKVIAVPNKFTKDHDFSKADLVVQSLNSVDLSMIN